MKSAPADRPIVRATPDTILNICSGSPAVVAFRIHMRSGARGGPETRAGPWTHTRQRDKESLRARLREARANLQAAEAAREAAAAQLKKNEIEAEAPDAAFAQRSHARAEQLFEQKLVSQSQLDDAQSALELAENRK